MCNMQMKDALTATLIGIDDSPETIFGKPLQASYLFNTFKQCAKQNFIITI